MTPITRDAKDDYLIALAREAGVDAIVSGDADLLELAQIHPGVVSPSRLVEQLRRST